jgi:hypothetical protein
MNRKRIILIVFGWLCICLNAVGWLGVITTPNSKYVPHGIPETPGFNFWFVLGFALLSSANKLKKKIRKKAEQEEFDSFLIDSATSTNYTE